MLLRAFHLVFVIVFAFAAHCARAATDARERPPLLIVGVFANGTPPLDQLEDTRLAGFSADYLRLLMGSGVELTPRVFADMPALLAAACAGQIDVVMSQVRAPQSERCLVFTAPYLDAGNALVTRAGNEGVVTSLARLAHARIAVRKDGPLESVLHERFPKASILAYPTLPDALRALSAGTAEAYADLAPAVRLALAQGAFADLRIAREQRLPRSALRFGVPRRKPALRDRLNTALASVRPADAAALRARWLGGEAPVGKPAFALSAEERNWLRALPVLKVGVDAGSRRPAGIVGDYLDYLARVLGVRFVELPVSTEQDAPDPFRHNELAMRAMSVRDDFVSFAVRPDLVPLLALIDRALAVMPAAQRARIRERWGVLHPLQAGGWSVNALRLLPFVIVMGVVLFVTLRAYALLEREMHRRQRAERILARHVELQDTMMEMIPYPFGARDMEGRYIAVNRAYEDATGLQRAQVIGRSGASVQAWGEENSRRVDQLYGQAIRDGGNPRMELVWKGPDGDARHGIFWTRLCRDTQGTPLCVLGTMIDVTEIRRAELMAEAASRAKDDFLAMMSHEIRTPMNGVLGLVEALERTPLDADQMQMIGMVQESAGALLQILDDLLDYAKIQAGRLDIAAEPFDVRELVDSAVGLLAGRAHEKGLTVRVDVAPDVAGTLSGDSVRLRQVLFNLLSNAIKFTPGGEVSVSVSAQDLPGTGAREAARQRLSLCVADTGIGIDAQAQARLFEPFTQVESTTTRRFGGTGLGLAICRRLAGLMGGTLELRSEPGQGTELTLQVELPVESRGCALPALRGKRALVACDDARVAVALAHFGAAMGLSVTTASRADLEASGSGAWADADLVLACESCVGATEDKVGRDAAVVNLSSRPEPTGYRVAGQRVSVSVNPLTWRGFVAACLSALAGAPSALARASADAASALTAPDRETERAAGRLILVAEDHAVGRVVIANQLALLGFACDVVDDGEQALAALARQRYGCLITDCHMPNMSGYDLARRVRQIEREQKPARRLPILAITANTTPESLQLCEEAGMDDCIIKPTRVAALRERLVRLFGEQDVQGATPAMHVGAAAQSPAAPGAEAFAPLDLAHMIEVWASDEKVRTLLETFVSAVRGDLAALTPLLNPVDIVRLREWHHRLAGAVGVLQYPPLMDLVEAYRADIDAYDRQTNRATLAQLRAGARQFMRACNIVLDSIEAQAAKLA